MACTRLVHVEALESRRWARLAANMAGSRPARGMRVLGQSGSFGQVSPAGQCLAGFLPDCPVGILAPRFGCCARQTDVYSVAPGAAEKGLLCRRPGSAPMPAGHVRQVSYPVPEQAAKPSAFARRNVGRTARGVYRQVREAREGCLGLT